MLDGGLGRQCRDPVVRGRNVRRAGARRPPHARPRYQQGPSSREAVVPTASRQDFLSMRRRRRHFPRPAIRDGFPTIFALVQSGSWAMAIMAALSISSIRRFSGASSGYSRSIHRVPIVIALIAVYNEHDGLPFCCQVATASGRTSLMRCGGLTWPGCHPPDDRNGAGDLAHSFACHDPHHAQAPRCEHLVMSQTSRMDFPALVGGWNC